MSGLIEELKHEHSKIAVLLKEVLQLGINSNEGRKRLFDARGYLLAHLRKEDTRLYPVLREASLENTELSQLLDNCIDEMDEISKAALSFFDQYAQGGDEQSFVSDFKQLYRVLNERILREETELYDIYDDFQRQCGGGE